MRKTHRRPVVPARSTLQGAVMLENMKTQFASKSGGSSNAMDGRYSFAPQYAQV